MNSAHAVVEISSAMPFVVKYNGEPFGAAGKVRGAGGIGHAEVAKLANADALRTWDRAQWQWAFENAAKSGLKVSAGIDLTHEKEKYSTDEWCSPRNKYWKEQLSKILVDVSKYKSNSALLWWTVGNELEEQISFTTGSDCLWRRVEWVARQVKKTDPHHPVGTVIANIHPSKVGKIRDLCPSIEFLGINVYGSDSYALGPRLLQYGWSKPYAITEYGVPGWWTVPTNAWGARLEPLSSSAKAPFFHPNLPVVRRRQPVHWFFCLRLGLEVGEDRYLVRIVQRMASSRRQRISN